MRTSIETAAITQDGKTEMASVIVTSFGPEADPLSLADQEHELRIRIEGLSMEAEMLAWARTGDFSARGNAERHRIHMEELIKGRSDPVKARMERERGLSDDA